MMFLGMLDRRSRRYGASRVVLLVGLGCAASLAASLVPPLSAQERLRLEWNQNMLYIRGAQVAGDELEIHYLEAYCRPGSTDRDWRETVIDHTTERLSAADDGSFLELRDRLRDGVVVTHRITAGVDEVDFRLEAVNPTATDSQAHWAQPCIRVDKFTGCSRADARALVPEYARRCFVFLEGKLTRLPTQPWAEQARYVPGQVYCPAHVSREDVNPRPLSRLVPSNGLTGCFSADGRAILAVAWEPYQELFQGVIACMHSDFRLGGVKAGETKQIRGKIYFVPADEQSLIQRYERDFPEHVTDARRKARTTQ
ncbi:MAG: hypothetical protein AB7O38_23020 [Pirellulaceae bacterium]